MTKENKKESRIKLNHKCVFCQREIWLDEGSGISNIGAFHLKCFEESNIKKERARCLKKLEDLKSDDEFHDYHKEEIMGTGDELIKILSKIQEELKKDD